MRDARRARRAPWEGQVVITSNDLVTAIRSRGSNADDVRDAAHEATHAMQSRLRGPWGRERLHAALEGKAKREAGSRMFVSQMLRYELQARAVEMLVCAHYNEPYDCEKWAMWCAMETANTYRVDVGGIDRLVDAIGIVSKQCMTLALFDTVMAIRPLRTKAQP